MRKTIAQCLTVLGRESWPGLVWLGMLALSSSLLEGLSLGILFPFIEVVGNPNALDRYPALRERMVGLGLDVVHHPIQVAVALVMAVFVFKNAVLLYATWYRARFVRHHQVALSERLMRRYMNAPYDFHLRRNSSELVVAINSSVSSALNNVLFSFVDIVTEALAVAAILTTLLLANAVVTVSAAAFLGLCVGAFYVLFSRRMRGWSRQQDKAFNATLLALNEGLGAVKEIRVLGRTETFTQAVRTPLAELAEINGQAKFLQALPRHFMEIVMVLGMVMAILVLVRQGKPVQEMMATLGLFAAAGFRMIPSANRLLMASGNIHLGAVPVDNVATDLGLLPEPPPPGPRPEPIPFERQLRLDDLCFAYEGRDTAALAHASLTVAKGESIGIVGRSGAGKSTLVDVVLGVLRPQTGRILVDDADVTDAIGGWQRRIGYVPQQIFITDASIRRNIAFGLPDDQIDEERISYALDAAHLSAMVESLPEGMHTRLGEGGVRLSGGQRQRIGIARALYHDPDVLVMDEATSALDTETEHEITRTVAELHGAKTFIVIAHRLSTVRHCDRIVLMDQGRIVDSGPFDELQARNADFAALVRRGDLSLVPG
ncbi:hypothetical protein WV31_13060 [Magnetospirillum sp. ME-1]|uniref:ABC transporter ATP-binding protein n=1 Tax=Magnetospirillum sp. ME-1 TaxID=1639348 RepID=UPI000A17CBCD|nr:ABC transporter ATP-binding protein [Magnetospirillum sp. ME-1]ARJ66531.1 hypothetical protein WV31_13060 [Magnetospirillum sp. ME-1]